MRGAVIAADAQNVRRRNRQACFSIGCVKPARHVGRHKYRPRYAEASGLMSGTDDLHTIGSSSATATGARPRGKGSDGLSARRHHKKTESRVGATLPGEATEEGGAWYADMLPQEPSRGFTKRIPRIKKRGRACKDLGSIEAANLAQLSPPSCATDGSETELCPSEEEERRKVKQHQEMFSSQLSEQSEDSHDGKYGEEDRIALPSSLAGPQAQPELFIAVDPAIQSGLSRSIDEIMMTMESSDRFSDTLFHLPAAGDAAPFLDGLFDEMDFAVPDESQMVEVEPAERTEPHAGRNGGGNTDRHLTQSVAVSLRQTARETHVMEPWVNCSEPGDSDTWRHVAAANA